MGNNGTVNKPEKLGVFRREKGVVLRCCFALNLGCFFVAYYTRYGVVLGGF